MKPEPPLENAGVINAASNVLTPRKTTAINERTLTETIIS